MTTYWLIGEKQIPEQHLISNLIPIKKEETAPKIPNNTKEVRETKL